MKKSTAKQPFGGGNETTRVLEYALADVAAELARLLRKFLKANTAAEGGGRRVAPSHQDMSCMLAAAFTSQLFAPKRKRRKAAMQRHALAFAVAAASVPSDLKLSGVSSEISRVRQEGVKDE
jgi:hypothetical protein